MTYRKSRVRAGGRSDRQAAGDGRSPRHRPHKDTPSWRYLAFVFIMTVIITGCDERVVLRGAGADQGLVILFPGIDGRSGYSEAAGRAICADDPAGLSVELQDWTSPLGAIFNQTAVARNREVARTIAVRITEYQKEHPDRPVYLIGHSGGTAIAVWAAEGLPEGEQVEGIILLASSLSPGYDLSEALAHSRSGIVNFYSPWDGILGAGTAFLGTMDGVHSESAGKAGFDGDYDKLYQVPWTSAMREFGNGGDHFGWMATRFIRTYVDPMIRSDGWNPELVALATEGKGNEAFIAATPRPAQPGANDTASDVADVQPVAEANAEANPSEIDWDAFYDTGMLPGLDDTGTFKAPGRLAKSN